MLGEAEYIDRIESAVEAARRTVGKLGSQANGSPATRGLVGKMALRLHLLEQAWQDIGEGVPSAAWIGIRSDDRTAKSIALAGALSSMYRRWAERGGMSASPLDLPGWDFGWSVEGFAALRILRDERGLHLGEEGGLGETARVTVAVAAQPAEPPSMLPAAVGKVAAEQLEQAQSADLVRRYQERPTPLVRDRRRGYRTGRLDLVLAGCFDLLAD